MPTESEKTARLETIAQALALAGLLLALHLGLLTALLAGLLIYALVQLLVPALHNIGINPSAGKTLALSIPVAAIGLGVTFGVISIIDFLTGGFEGVIGLLRRMAEIVDTARSRLPEWAQAYLPETTAELQAAVAAWLRAHAGELGIVSQDIGKFIFYVIIGMIIGGLLAVQSAIGPRAPGPLTHAMTRRAEILHGAFRSIVFSQVRISALNTTLTGIYLAVILPAFNVELPFVKTLIAVTFLAGLLPVLGNLISNTVIFIVSLSVSPTVAISSLAFLIIIHKLEYFANARIIGSRIRARAWELLVAMLVMEAAFGIPGLIAAPIYYAYLKDELIARGLI